MYFVEITGENGQLEERCFPDREPAESLFHRALGAVRDATVVEDGNGVLVRLIGCRLFEVSAESLQIAREKIKNNQARRLRDSDDKYYGEVLVFENLFRRLH